MYFAAYLHMAFITGWRARTRAWFAACGFFVTALCGMGSSLNEMRLLRIGG
jgi:ABC-type transport system involved in cytochrome c biogenesis permease subunit